MRRAITAFSRCLALVLFFALGGVRAQEPTAADPIVTAYNEGMGAFNAGNYSKAVEQLELFFKLAPSEVKVEAPFFTLASAYFNLPDLGKAMVAYEKYLTLFPRGERANSARLGIALAAMKSGETDKAIAQLTMLEQLPATREQALLYQAMTFIKAEQSEKAIAPLERLTGKPVKMVSAMQAEGAMLLAESLIKAGKWPEAGEVIGTINAHPAAVENHLRLNIAILRVGDHLLQEGRAPEALQYYRRARFRDEVTTLQKKRVADLEGKIVAAQAQARIPAFAAAASDEAARLKESLNEAKDTLAGFEKLPDFDESVWFRIGRAYLDAGRPWEAMLVERHALEKFPGGKMREPAMATMIFAMLEIVPAAETQESCKIYLAEFPKGPQADMIGYLSGAVALQKGDYASAASFFGAMLDQQPDSTRRGEMFYMLGNALFLQGKFPEAREKYDAYLREFPDGEFAGEVTCRRALAFIYDGKFEEAIVAFQQYLERYPTGPYVPEAKYRLAVTDYASKQYEKVIADCRAWAAAYPGDQLQGENYALLGDACEALERIEEAAQAYRQAVETAKTDDVTQYALTKAQKMYQKNGQWDEVAALFRGFIDQHPESPLVVMALYWVGRAQERLGEPEEARQYTAQNIRKYLNDQRRDAVEQLLQLYAQLAAKRKKTTDSTVDPASETSAIEKEIAAALSGSEKPTPLAQARILYTQAETAKLRRKPERAAVLEGQIAINFSPADLSAPLLALAGNKLLDAGRPEKARACFQMLGNDFSKSPYADAADVGLGELALADGDHAQAEKLFRSAIAKAGMKLPDALVGLSRTLMAEGKYPEAEKMLQQVAATKQWRGERTAESLFFLGEIEFGKGRYAEANAYFQRVFVSWRKFPVWVARSYLKSADCFLKLGRSEEAVRTWEEMARQENLTNLPEMKTAQKLLEAKQG